jgi:S-adenosylmethionine:diacylglycerol 3-amino-3-carboxypropyl transferase
MIAKLTLEVFELNEQLLSQPVIRIEAHEEVDSKKDVLRMIAEFGDRAQRSASVFPVQISPRETALKEIQEAAKLI